MKKTGWFPAYVKPTHIGVYERNFGSGVDHFYSYWDGVRWGILARRIWSAYECRKCVSEHQRLEWRGIEK